MTKRATPPRPTRWRRRLTLSGWPDAPLVVVHDANVLYPSTLRDVLIRVGLSRLVALTPWGMEAQHPDAFLTSVHQNHPHVLGEIVKTIAHAWGTPDATPEQVIARLAVDAPDTAKLVRASLPDEPAT